MPLWQLTFQRNSQVISVNQTISNAALCIAIKEHVFLDDKLAQSENIIVKREIHVSMTNVCHYVERCEVFPGHV